MRLKLRKRKYERGNKMEYATKKMLAEQLQLSERTIQRRLAEMRKVGRISTINDGVTGERINVREFMEYWRAR